MATLEASKVATGYKTMWRIEIHGSEGGLIFDLSKGNDLQFYTKDDPLYLQGMRTINVVNQRLMIMQSTGGRVVIIWDGNIIIFI